MSNPKLLRGRHSELGAHYAVTAVCAGRVRLFEEQRFAAAVVCEIQGAVFAGSIASHAWVVMPDHIHLLFELRSGALSDTLRSIKSRSARTINQLRRSAGAVWQPNFYDHRIGSASDLLKQARYICANPIRASLVTRIEDYPHWHSRWINTQQDLLL